MRFNCPCARMFTGTAVLTILTSRRHQDLFRFTGRFLNLPVGELISPTTRPERALMSCPRALRDFSPRLSGLIHSRGINAPLTRGNPFV